MNRTDFIQKLITAGGVATLGGYLRKKQVETIKELEILACPVAGYQFHQGEKVESQFRQGDPVRLVREPYNKHDSNATAIYYRNTRIGYIPMAYNLILAHLLDGGVNTTAFLDEINLSLESWNKVSVKVMMPVELSSLVENERDARSKRELNKTELLNLYTAA